jgi:Ran GTPase-activating protein (RanGAP) involved in mRNA processing and transport
LADVVISELSKGEASMGRKPAGVQPDLPGVDQEKVPALERLIKKYQNLKLERMDASKLEVAAKTAVIEKMHELKIPVYKRPGHFPFKATLTPAGETLKVEEVDEDDVEGEGGGGEASEDDEDE